MGGEGTDYVNEAIRQALADSASFRNTVTLAVDASWDGAEWVITGAREAAPRSAFSEILPWLLVVILAVAFSVSAWFHVNRRR
jgi:hypothetical protein